MTKSNTATLLLILTNLIMYTNNTFSQGIGNSKHRVHDGFYFSFAGGANYSMIKSTDDNNEYFFSGLGSIIDFKFGYELTPNLIGHLSFIFTDATSPNIKSNGETQEAPDYISIGQAIVGPGLTYYSSNNSFLSATIGLGNSQMRNSELDEVATTDKGLTIQLKAGHEWWITRRWALGTGLSYSTSFISTDTNNAGKEKVYANNIAALITLTFN